MRAALYVRVSSLAQAREGYSLEFQHEILPKQDVKPPDLSVGI